MRKMLITGVGRGFGRELAKVGIARGNVVYGVFRNGQHQDGLVREFGDRFMPIIADVTLDSSIKTINEAIRSTTDVIDCVINNAGIPGKSSSIATITGAEIASLVSVHCIGALNTAKASVDFLYKSANPRIINISSRFGSLKKTASGDFKDIRISYSYRIAKAAQNMLTICLANELNSKNIQLYAVHPGQLKTDSGLADAEIMPIDAAIELYDKVVDSTQRRCLSYMQPGVGDLEW